MDRIDFLGFVLLLRDISRLDRYSTRHNKHRLWGFGTPRLLKNIPDVKTTAAGFYAVNGTSVLRSLDSLEQERIGEMFEAIREQNPGQRILLVLDNFSSHVCEYTRKRAHQLDTNFVFLPVGSPDLNPIEQVWKSLKWEASPLIVESAAEYRALLTTLYEQLTTRLRFAPPWVDDHLSGYLQKLC